jgi:hypothetical protein
MTWAVKGQIDLGSHKLIPDFTISSFVSIRVFVSEKLSKSNMLPWSDFRGFISEKNSALKDFVVICSCILVRNRIT